MKITSKKGMVVEMADSQWAKMVEVHGDKAREMVLTTAARSFEHKEALKGMNTTLTDEQLAKAVERAFATKRQQLILDQAVEMGYEEYVTRYLKGGMMPESWARVYDNAAAVVFGRKSEQSLQLQGVDEATKKRIRAVLQSKDSEFQPELTSEDIDFAAGELGFTTVRDIEYSSKVAAMSKDWVITPATVLV